MATTGYLESSWGSATSLAHSQQHRLFFATSRGKWYASRYDGVDHFLYEWDGNIPANPGDEGVWTKSVNESDVAVTITTTNTAAPCFAWDDANNTLHIFHPHSTTEQYSQWTLNASNGKWTNTVATETITVTGGGAEYGAITFDSSGRPWIVWSTSTTVFCKVRVSGSWEADFTIDTYTDVGANDHKAAITRFVDGSGNPGVCIAYTANNGTNDVLLFAYRLDSAGTTDAWTKETIDSSHLSDDHVDMQSAVFSGDTASTVWVVTKTSGTVNNLVYRRSPAGSWSSQYNVTGTFTRPRVCIDTTNKQVYVSGQATTDFATTYYVLDATADPTAALSGPTVAIEDDGVATVGNDHDSPCHSVTSTSGLMYGNKFSTNELWWNRITIAAAAAATPRDWAGLALNGPLRRAVH